jgi:hypothetical protein
LTNYVLGFIPFGGLISSQANIVYGYLVRPISDSVVYQLIVPVVNDPLNPASYVNGAIAVGQATVNGLISAGFAELNYFFGGLIPPLPFAANVATEKGADVEAQPTARRHLFGGLAELKTDVDEQVQVFTGATFPKPRDAARAIEAALKPVLAGVTKDPVTAATDLAGEDAQAPAAVNKFVKNWTARRGAEQSAQTDGAAAPAAPFSKRKPKHATEASDASAQPKAAAPSGAKDRGLIPP